MEDFAALVKGSRSIRRFREDERIGIQILEELVDTARFCPSAGNRQPVRYILTTDPEKMKEIYPCLVWAMDLPDFDGPAEGERPVAAITLVTECGLSIDPCYDIGIAAQTILLAAASRGIGGCILGSLDRQALSRIFQLPENLEIRLLIALGVPAERVVLEEVGPDGDTRYWRDDEDVHHVPKRSLDEVIIGRFG
ncbi:MAG: nitroreductase family protein [Methanoculleaceae archaeon]